MRVREMVIVGHMQRWHCVAIDYEDTTMTPRTLTVNFVLRNKVFGCVLIVKINNLKKMKTSSYLRQKIPCPQILNFAIVQIRENEKNTKECSSI